MFWSVSLKYRNAIEDCTPSCPQNHIAKDLTGLITFPLDLPKEAVKCRNEVSPKLISFQCCKTPNSHRQTITHHIKLIGRLCSHVHSKLNGSFLCWNLTRFQKSDQNIVSAHRGIFESMIWLEVVARKRSQISKLKKKASYYYHCACINRDEINSISRKQLKRTCSVSSCLDPHVDHGQQIIYYEEKYIFSCGKKVDHPERTKKGSFCSQSEHTIRFLQGHPTRI